jgi:glycosyltransferase involved in cell wall biosynthesis
VKEPQVSVLMTAYNREDYIAEAIESVLAQTMQDLELVIVDDGSKDHTVAIARRYTNDPRVRLHLNEQNLGDYPNRNRAAELAQGKYLKYLDADDMMYPHCLEMMVHQMEQFPQASLGFTLAPRKEWLYPVALSPQDAYRLEFLGSGGLGNGPTFAIYRKDAFHKVGGFPIPRFTSDRTLTLTLARESPVVFMAPGLVFYRYHAFQEGMAELSNVEAFSRRARVNWEALTHPLCPLSKSEQARALRNIFGLFLRVVAREFFRGRLRTGVMRWKLSGVPLGRTWLVMIPSQWPYRDTADGLNAQAIRPNWKAYPRSRQPDCTS